MTERRRSIFNFNHISNQSFEDQIKEIRALYKYYHKKYWCFKQAFKRSMMNLGINLSSTGLVVIGTITGAVTLNPIILGSISGAGILLKTFAEFKNYKKKMLR